MKVSSADLCFGLEVEEDGRGFSLIDDGRKSLEPVLHLFNCLDDNTSFHPNLPRASVADDSRVVVVWNKAAKWLLECPVADAIQGPCHDVLRSEVMAVQLCSSPSYVLGIVSAARGP